MKTTNSDLVSTDGSCAVAAVLGVDGRVVRGPTEITVTGGVIVQVRPAAVRPRPTLVAMPPLVNGHDHGRGAGLAQAGIADGPLETWLTRLGSDHRPQTELVAVAADLMVRNGVGVAVFCVNPKTPDIEAEIRHACAAIRSVGIRATVVVPFLDITGRMRGRHETGWRAADMDSRLEMFSRLRVEETDALIELQLGPAGPQWMSEYALCVVGDFALTHDLRVHMHLLESPAQRAWADEVYPEGVLRWMDGVGLLGPHTWFAHGTQLRGAELEMLAERGCGLVLNASSNLRLCSGFAPVHAAAQTGVDTAIGLDGLSLNEDGDPWTELRLLRGIGQGQSHQTIAAADILAIAFNPAVSGEHRPGPIVEGRLADFVLLDISARAHLLDRPDWSVQEVVLAGPAPVHTIWIGGRVVHQAAAARRPVPVGIGDLA